MNKRKPKYRIVKDIYRKELPSIAGNDTTVKTIQEIIKYHIEKKTSIILDNSLLG